MVATPIAISKTNAAVPRNVLDEVLIEFRVLQVIA